MTGEYLFVYGTLRKNIVRAERPGILEEHGVFCGEGCLFGLLNEIDPYPGAVISEERNHRVKGDIYRVQKGPGVWQTLDDYEECSEAYPEPHEYRKVHRDIHLENGERDRAWVYLYNRDTEGLERIESGDYLESLSGKKLDIQALSNSGSCRYTEFYKSILLKPGAGNACFCPAEKQRDERTVPI